MANNLELINVCLYNQRTNERMKKMRREVMRRDIDTNARNGSSVFLH